MLLSPDNNNNAFEADRKTSGNACGVDEQEISTAWRATQMCYDTQGPQKYCCATYKPPLTNCHWVGQGDCADNTCNNAEVVLLTNPYGDNGNACACKALNPSFPSL